MQPIHERMPGVDRTHDQTREGADDAQALFIGEEQVKPPLTGNQVSTREYLGDTDFRTFFLVFLSGFSIVTPSFPAHFQ